MFLKVHAHEAVNKFNYTVTHEPRKPYQRNTKIFVTLKMTYNFLAEHFDSRSEFDKDIINLRRIGARIKESVKGDTHIDLRKLSFQWLRDSFVDLLRVCISGVSSGWVQQRLNSIIHFNTYLVSKNQHIEGSDQIDRELIKGFVRYINSLRLKQRRYSNESGDLYSAKSRYYILLTLKNFINECIYYNIGNFPKKNLFRSIDFPRLAKISKIKWIEEDVVVQIKRHSDKLPSPHREILLVMLALGNRPTDTVTLPYTCLDESKDIPTITSFNSKVQKDSTVPVIDPELLSLIHSAQERARILCGENTRLLFPKDNRGQCLAINTLSDRISLFIRENEIRGSNGKLWRFNNYQCRHTFATDMLNAGADLNSVRVALNHVTFISTNIYAKVRDNCLKQKWALANGYQVDVTGKIIEVRTDYCSADSVQNQWLKTNILKRALPNGYCNRNADQPTCETGNKCIHCPSFRTGTQFKDILAAQFDIAKANITEGKLKGFERLIDINEKDASRLQIILGRLDEIALMEAGHA